jgi:hypothetical protein
MDYVVASTTATYMWLTCKAGSLNITRFFVLSLKKTGPCFPKPCISYIKSSIDREGVMGKLKKRVWYI